MKQLLRNRSMQFLMASLLAVGITAAVHGILAGFDTARSLLAITTALTSPYLFIQDSVWCGLVVLAFWIGIYYANRIIRPWPRFCCYTLLATAWCLYGLLSVMYDIM